MVFGCGVIFIFLNLDFGLWFDFGLSNGFNLNIQFKYIIFKYILVIHLYISKPSLPGFARDKLDMRYTLEEFIVILKLLIES